MLFLAALLLASQPIPIGSAADWFNGMDYPPLAARRGQQGSVEYELAIDESGQTVGCKIIKSSGSPILDSATCARLLKMARFSPATDENGAALPSTYRGSTTWSFPNLKPARARSTRTVDVTVQGLRPNLNGSATVLEIAIDPSGHVASCTAIGSSGDLRLDRAACNHIPNFEAGVAEIVTIEVRWNAGLF